MKKLLATASVIVTLSGLPATGAFASSDPYGGVAISNNQQQNYSAQRNNDNSSNSALEASYSKTVNFEALYYVKYSATTTSYYKQSNNNNYRNSSNDNRYNNSQNYFNTAGMGTNY